MSIKDIQIGLFLLINLIIKSLQLLPLLSEETCSLYTCSELPKLVCSNQVIISSIIELQSCPHNYFCNYRENKQSRCEKSEYEYNQPAYPGGKCTTNTDCLNNQCVNNICATTAACVTSKNCDFSTRCSNFVCVAPALEGEECKNDEDCAWPLGCFNARCTRFFSLPNGNNGDQNKPLFCASGKVYKGKCDSVHDSVDDQCDDSNPCSYINSNGETITIPDACYCRYQNADDDVNKLLSSKACLKGDINNPYWQTVLSIFKDSISSQYANQCNAAEHRPGYCRETLRHSWPLRSKIIELDKSWKLSYYSNLISPSLSTCFLKSILQFDDTPPMPASSKFQCPTYHCNTEDKDSIPLDDTTCAYSINPFNEAGNEITVDLKESCPDKYKCAYDLNGVFSNWTTNSTCKEIPTDKSWRHKYPGEECTSHLQCIEGSNETIGLCIEGICSGRKEGEACEKHGDCLKGLFCNGLQCQDQKKEDGFCLDAYDCRNYLGCLNNTCVPYYSLSNGTFLNQTHPDPSLCKMGIMNIETKQCAESDYYNLSPNKQKDDAGFVECSIGEKCEYTTGFYSNGKIHVESVECTCGYRGNGKAYCPIPQTINQKEWKNYFKLKNKQYDNKCHTLRRNECVEEISYDDQDELNYYKRKTINAHLFYESENCIIKVLTGNKISLTMITFVIFNLLLF